MGKTKAVAIGPVAIGGGRELVLIAGPCVIEDRRTCLRIAGRLAKLADPARRPQLLAALAALETTKDFAQLPALFATTPGISVVKDTIFPQRFMHCSELKRMGADIKVDNGTAVISGVETLSGAPVMASDLRASAALVLAALKAEGTTEIHRLYHIDRGYEMIDEKLLAIGAAVERLPDDDN